MRERLPYRRERDDLIVHRGEVVDFAAVRERTVVRSPTHEAIAFARHGVGRQVCVGIVVDANVDHIFVTQNINSTWLETDDVAIGHPVSIQDHRTAGHPVTRARSNDLIAIGLIHPTIHGVASAYEGEGVGQMNRRACHHMVDNLRTAVGHGRLSHVIP